jgi:sulfur transfer complex TusBCD TusB component (DsrH family)
MLRAAVEASYILAQINEIRWSAQMSAKADIIARGYERKWARLNVLVLRNAQTGSFYPRTLS